MSWRGRQGIFASPRCSPPSPATATRSTTILLQLTTAIVKRGPKEQAGATGAGSTTSCACLARRSARLNIGAVAASLVVTRLLCRRRERRASHRWLRHGQRGLAHADSAGHGRGHAVAGVGRGALLIGRGVLGIQGADALAVIAGGDLWGGALCVWSASRSTFKSYCLTKRLKACGCTQACRRK